jgi:hypothetical protein
MSQRVCGLVALLIATASILACRQLVGITDNPPEDLVTSICGLPYGTNVCASCVSTSCCAESTACASDPTCAAYEGCLGKCNGDPKCRSLCTIDNPVGTDANVLALGVCLASNCETACGLECGAIADLISGPDAAVACEECLKTNACAKAEACASSEPCYAYARANNIDTFATLDTGELYEQLLCASTAASGLAFDIFGSVEVCGGNPPTIDTDASASSTATSFESLCTTPCASGNYWACVDHVTWPPPNASTSTMHWQVEDYPGGAAPVGGVTVQVCSPDEPTCSASTEVTHGTTDPSGRVSLTVPNMPDPLNLGLNGFVRVSSPNIVTTDQYWGFPLVEAQLVFDLSEVVTPTELQAFWETANVTTDPSLGAVSVVAVDCRFQAASGVNIKLSSTNIQTKGVSTTFMPTSTTDQTGLVLFANVPTGPLTLTATPNALGRPSSQVNVIVQAGIVTVVQMFPTPMP